MTKAEELTQLSAFIKALGPDTYLGPWLSQVRAEVAKQIECDIFPDIMLGDAERQVAAMRKAADEYAAATRAGAERKAQAIVKEAQDRATSISGRIHRELREAAAAFGFSSSF